MNWCWSRKNSRGRFLREFFLIGIILWFALAGPASAELITDPEIFEEEAEPESWGHSYQFPLPDEEVYTWDKSFPLPEVLKKLSAPTHYYEYVPEEIAPRVVDARDFPLPVNPYVENYVNYWSREKPKSFRYLYRRSGLYEDLILAELKKRRMPEELIYLCMIESAFNPRAVSIANAKGLWQFIYRTGRRYNLEIDYWIDERYDPEKSTRAALDYLTDLYEIFGDWHLAAASYNCGEAYVARRLQKTGCDTFWCLIDMGKLPSETRHYVPKIVATAIIGQNLEHYGFYNLNKLPSIQYSTVRVDDAVDLRTIADCAGTSLKEIEGLNPSLLRFCTPPGVRGFEVHIPYGKTEQFKKAYARLSPEQRHAFKKHKVEKGQSLQSIATGYGTSYKLMASLNNLEATANLREGQTLIVPVAKDTRYDPNRRPAPEPEIKEGRTEIKPRTPPGPIKPRDQTKPKPKSEPRQLHVVEPGDTLWAIAKLYEVSVDDIKKSNLGIDEHNMYIGDELVVPSRVQPKPREGASPTPKRPPGSTRTVTYTVRDGDICYWIARHYGIHSQEIIQKNNLDPQCTIRSGQEITLVVPKNAPTSLPPLERPTSFSPREETTIPLKPTNKPAAAPSGAKKVSYTFGGGDTLWQVAREHDVHVAEILAWNGLDENYMPQPGQTVVIYIDPNWKPPVKPKSSSPVRATSVATDPQTTENKPTGTRGKPVQYTVKPGDSLWGIARNHDVRVAEIVAWNGLDSETVHQGQVLTIKPGPGYSGSTKKSETKKEDPKPASSTTSKSGKKISYTVKPGDSLWGIARYHDVRIAEILGWNDLPEDASIQPGQELTIYVAKGWKPPKPDPSSGDFSSVNNTPPDSSSKKKEVGLRGKPITYVVQEGDSLWGIARKHDVYCDEIKQWNNMSSDTVRPGQKLTIRPGPGYKP